MVPDSLQAMILILSLEAHVHHGRKTQLPGNPQINQHLLKGEMSWVNSPLAAPHCHPWWGCGCRDTHPGSCGSGTAGPRPTCPATGAPPRAALRTRSRWPTHPRGGRSACPPPAAPGSGTTGWPRSRCSSHWDQLGSERHEQNVASERCRGAIIIIICDILGHLPAGQSCRGRVSHWPPAQPNTEDLVKINTVFSSE